MKLKSLLLGVGAMAISSAATAEAATSKRVVFDSNGDRLVGDLFLPDDYEQGDKLPAVIVTGAWTTVKEQMPLVYAEEMADRGYAALVFDFRGWGQSEGDRRQYEHPERKTEDILAAAQYLSTRQEVNAGRIGGLGICASSGYMADAAARSTHIRSLALVAPWLHDEGLVFDVYGGAEGVAALTQISRDADKAYAATGEQKMALAASMTDDSAIMYQAPYYTDPETGLIPEYVNEFNLSSWEPWLTYDAISIADKLDTVPVQIVHSDAAAIPQGARSFYARLQGHKSELWLDDVTQFDFYHVAAPVTAASNSVAAHFKKTLPQETGQ
jgi:hypothetical protein